MAFEYTPYRNPYIGTIADLMARGEDAKAKALIDVASAQARAAEAKGQIYGNAISSIGQGIAKSLTDYNDPKRKLQEMAFNQAATDARAEEATRNVLGQTERPMVRTAVPGTPFDAATINIVPPDQQAVGSRAFGSVGFGAPVQPRSPQSLFGTTEIGTQSITPDSTFVESLGPERPKFNDPETGIFDLNNLQQEFLKLRDVDGKPFSPAVIAARLKPIQEINESILDYDAKKDSLNKSQQVAFGTMANGILKFVEDNGGSYTDAARMAVVPWEKRLGKEAVADFMRNFERLAPRQQVAQLEASRNQAASLLPKKTVAKDAIEFDAFDRETARGATGTPPNPTKASLAAIVGNLNLPQEDRNNAQRALTALDAGTTPAQSAAKFVRVTFPDGTSREITAEYVPGKGQPGKYYFSGQDITSLNPQLIDESTGMTTTQLAILVASGKDPNGTYAKALTLLQPFVPTTDASGRTILTPKSLVQLGDRPSLPATEQNRVDTLKSMITDIDSILEMADNPKTWEDAKKGVGSFGAGYTKSILKNAFNVGSDNQAKLRNLINAFRATSAFGSGGKNLTKTEKELVDAFGANININPNVAISRLRDIRGRAIEGLSEFGVTAKTGIVTDPKDANFGKSKP